MHCPGKSITVNMEKKEDDGRWSMKVKNYEGCLKWMPNSAQCGKYAVFQGVLPRKEALCIGVQRRKAGKSLFLRAVMANFTCFVL